MMHKAWCNIEQVPYCFQMLSIKFQGHTGKNWQYWPELSVSGLQPKFEFTDGFEIINKAWHSIEDVSYHLFRSSIKCQGHTGWKIDNLNPIWDYWVGRSYQIPQICLVERCNQYVIRYQIIFMCGLENLYTRYIHWHIRRGWQQHLQSTEGVFSYYFSKLVDKCVSLPFNNFYGIFSQLISLDDRDIYIISLSAWSFD